MKNWRVVKLGQVLKPSKQIIDVEPEKQYKQVTIKMNRKGITQRGVIQGNQVGSKQYLAFENQFIISKIDARNGAYGIVPKELQGAIVTSDFLLFDNEVQIDISFLNYFSNTNYFDLECKKASEGTTNRVRLKIDKFLQIEIPLPPLPEQQRIAARLDALQRKIAEVTQLRAEQERAIANLLFSKYQQIIADAAWRPMKEVAPLVRRPVSIKENEMYPELGLRSFGKGTFHKMAVKGIDLGTKKIFTIKEGDLLFSNVFAWEGAIAVVKKEDDNRVGSHRFISCVAKENVVPEFLCFHFLTEKGLEDINNASPGGAGRNKTLGLDKLEKILVPIPDCTLQLEFLALKNKTEQWKNLKSNNQAALTSLFPSVLEKAFRGEW